MQDGAKFTICSYGDDFFAGRCDNGDQVLMGLLCPNLVAFRFDSEGKPIGRELRPWLHPAEWRGGAFAIYGHIFQERLAEQMAGWQSEIGFAEQPITVEMFYDAEQGVGIEPAGSKHCAFILWWAKDYWMDSAGGVEST
jgi:hypothetical protein